MYLLAARVHPAKESNRKATFGSVLDLWKQAAMFHSEKQNTARSIQRLIG
jgi:hypothetical protein